jgi:hypothetical protein
MCAVVLWHATCSPNPSFSYPLILTLFHPMSQDQEVAGSCLRAREGHRCCHEEDHAMSVPLHAAGGGGGGVGPAPPQPQVFNSEVFF